jgi:tetratricopeptide (TPR) repeat protein
MSLSSSKLLLLALTLSIVGLIHFPLKVTSQPSRNIIVQNNETDQLTKAKKLNDEAVELYGKGKYVEAEPLYQQALAIYQKVLGDEHPDTATLVNNLALLYYSQSNYPQAEAFYQRALAIRKKVLGDEHPDTATSVNNLALLYYSQSNYPQAEAFYQRALAIRKKVLGDEHPDTATSLHDLALLYLAQGNYQKAESFYQQALAIRKKVLGDEHPDTATSLNHLGALYLAQGNYQKAESFYQQSLAIRKNMLGDEHPDTATSFNDLALLYKNQGKYQEAEPLYQQALAIRKKVLGDEHPDTATSLNNLGALYLAQGDYPQAEPFYQQALAIKKKILGEQHPDTATSLNDLAALYLAQGNYQKAEPLYQQALAIYQKVLGDEHPYTATSMNHLAALYLAQGNYQKAESLYQQALAIYQKVLGDEHPDTATSMNHLGALYLAQGNYQEAEPFYQQSLAIRKKMLGDEHPDTATSLNELALLYKNQGNYSQAEPLYQQALAIRKKVLGEEHPYTATSLNNLALLYYSQGNYPQAEPLYQQALAIKKKALGDEHPDTATSLSDLALLYKSQGNYQKAEPLYQQALAIYRKVLGNEHPYTANSLNHLGVLSLATDRLALAIDYFKEGTNIEEINLSKFLNNIGDESRKQAYINTFSNSIHFTISLHLNFASNNPQASELAFTTILRRKGRVLDVMSDIVANLRQNSNPQTEALFNNLAEKRSQLTSLIYQGIGDRSLTAYQELITNLEENIRGLETDLFNQSVQFRAINQSITLEEVQKAIPDNTVLVEYMVYYPFNPKTNQWGKSRYAAYILHSKGKPQGVDLGETETIDKLVENFRLYLAYGNTSEPSELKNLSSYAQQLHHLIFEPLLPLLKDKKTLLISPDSQLNLIPFAALQNNQGKYLLEEYSISYLTSGRDLLQLQTQFSPQSETIIIANPTYDLDLDRSLMASASRGGNRRAGDLDSLKWCCDALPHTKGEAEAIIPLLSNPVVYMGNEALVENITKIKAPKILHLATHGFFLPDIQKLSPQLLTNQNLNNQITQSENPLLRSGLAFTGFNPNKNKMDGALTALDASSLYLWGTKLVVLSACQTGVGDVHNGDGVYGLRRAFVLAGVESQLMSLWDVFDEATKDLMTQYYQRLSKGEGRAEALRQVQLQMLRSDNLNHPVFWAAFIPSGDWRSLDEN